MCFTERQLRILQFIQAFRNERGISPTMEEIALNFGITKITVYGHLNQLERKGAVKREKFRARSVELLVELDDGAKKPAPGIPLAGDLRADSPLENGREENLDLAAMIPHSPGNCFVVRVKDGSLEDDQIFPGDYVIIERRSNAKNGETVLATLPDGRATLKRYYREKSRVRLQPTNRRLKPTYARHVEILGVMVGLLRRFSNN